MKRILGVILSVCLIFSALGCLSFAVSAEDVAITEIQLFDVVTSAKAGDPIKTVTVPDDANYTVTANWDKIDYDLGGMLSVEETVFQDKNYYRLNISIEPKEGYYFAIPSFFINGEQSYDEFGWSPDFASAYYDIPIGVTAINEVTLTAVTPALGKTLAEVGGNTAPAGANYTVITDWFYLDSTGMQIGMNENDVFTADNIYAQLTYVHPNEGYYFADEATVNCDGYISVYRDIARHDGITRYSFGNKVLDVELNGKTEILVGETASSSDITVPEGAGYKIDKAEWRKFDHETANFNPFDGVFEYGELYQLYVELVPTEGKKFSVETNDLTFKTMLFLNGEQVYDHNFTMTEDRITYASDMLFGSYSYMTIDSVRVGNFANPTIGDEVKAVTLTVDKNADYTATAKWVNADKTTAASGRFENGKKYYLAVTFTAKDGFGFIPEGGYVCPINGIYLDAAEQSASSLTYYYPLSFAPDIETADITVAGTELGSKLKDAAATAASDAPFTIESTTWYDDYYNELDPQATTFEDKKSYSLEIVISPKAGYDFSDYTDFTINKEATDDYYEQDGKWYISHRVSFKTPLTAAELTLPEAKVGEAVDYSAIKVPEDANYVIGNVSWVDYTTGEALQDGDVFEDMHEYGLEIMLWPGKQGSDSYDDMGYEFAEDATLTVNGKAAEPYEYDSYGFELYYYTAYSFLKSIDKIEFPALPDVKAGYRLHYISLEAPDGANYSFGYDWVVIDEVGAGAPIGSTAEDGNAYKLTVWAYPNDGYCFADDAEIYVGGKKANEGYSVDLHNSHTAITKTYNLGLEEIKRVEITAQKPYIGEKADTKTAITLPDGANFVVTSYKWHEYEEDAFDNLLSSLFNGVFADGKYYTVYIEVQPLPGYIFTDDTVFVINGKEVTLDGRLSSGDIAGVTSIYLTEKSSVRPIEEDKNDTNASGSIDIKPDGGIPPTGDSSNIVLCITLSLLCAAAAALSLLSKKRTV